MSLLSPSKPVRTRFRVAGEGSYSLAADMLPALPRLSSSPSITSARPPGSHAAAGLSIPSAADTRAHAAAGSPLGLHAATKVALAPSAALVEAPAPGPEKRGGEREGREGREGDGSVGGGNAGGAGMQKDAAGTGSGSMFSFRKLSALGTFAGFGGRTSATNSPTLGAGAAAPPQPPPPVAAQALGTGSVGGGLADAGNGGGGGGAKGGGGGGGGGGGLYGEHLGEEHLEEEDRGLAASGVLAYNFGDCVVVLDLAGHSAFSTAPDVSLTLRMRSAPSAHALAHAADRLRLVVGCVNGEVAFWEDVGATYSRDALSGHPAKRSRSAAAAAGNGLTMGGIVSGGGGGVGSGVSGLGGGDGAGAGGGGVTSAAAATSHSSQIVFNRDGNLNSSRVVAVRWLPGPGFRFVAVHIDGAVIVYDTRNKKAVAADATTGGATGAGGIGLGGGAPGLVGGHGAGGGTGQGGDYSSINGSNGTSEASGHGYSGYGLMNGLSYSNASAGANTSSGVSGTTNGGSVGGGFMSSFASIAEGGANALGISDKERERSGLSERSIPSAENGRIPGHRRTSSLPPAQIGQHDVVTSRPSRGKRINPVVVCHVGGGAVVDAAFAPGCGSTGEQVLLALASRDGYLRIVDLTREAMVIAFRSYFGALLCASWSPDGRYVAAGGEDDLVSIWCPAEERIVARCEGHTSWVSAVAWDESMCRDGRYRLGSAGQDAKLLLWDFSLDMLATRSSAHRHSSRNLAHHLPVKSTAPSTSALKTQASPPAVVASPLAAPLTSSPQVSAMGSTVGPSPERRPGKLARLRGHATGTNASREESEPQPTLAPPGPVIQALGRAQVPTIEPVLVHVAHIEPLTDVYFLDAGVVTADCVGNVKLWARPPQLHIPPLSLANTGKAHRGDLD